MGNDSNCCSAKQNQLTHLKNYYDRASIFRSQEEKDDLWTKLQNNYKISQLNTINCHQNQSLLLKYGSYFYSGKQRGGKMEGKGTLTKFDEVNPEQQQSCYEGTFKDNKAHDRNGKITFNNKKFIGLGQWQDGKPIFNGFKLRDKLGKYTITFLNSFEKAHVQFHDTNMTYKGHIDLTLENQKAINGKGILQKPNEFLADGIFENGKLNDRKGILILRKLNHKYIGSFIDGKFEGRGTYYYDSKDENGDRLIVNWKDNKPHGEGEYYYENKKYLINYKQGKRIVAPSQINTQRRQIE